jgi:hypothetical protein
MIFQQTNPPRKDNNGGDHDAGDGASSWVGSDTSFLWSAAVADSRGG